MDALLAHRQCVGHLTIACEKASTVTGKREGATPHSQEISPISFYSQDKKSSTPSSCSLSIDHLHSIILLKPQRTGCGTQRIKATQLSGKSALRAKQRHEGNKK